MDDLSLSVADRLKALREGRDIAVETPPINGLETAKQRAKLPGFDGRAQRVREIRGRVQGITPFEASGAPFENLVFTGKLLLPGERPDSALLRADAGYRFREDVEMAQISTLGAKDFGAVGGGGNKTMLADVKIYAMQSVGRLRDSVSKRTFWVLESLIVNDAWLLEMPRKRVRSAAARAAQDRRITEHRTAMLKEILQALDTAAVHYDMLLYPELKARWPNARYGSE